MGKGTQRESCKKKSYFRRFWVKEPGHSATISEKRCYLYRSMRPGVLDVNVILCADILCTGASYSYTGNKDDKKNTDYSVGLCLIERDDRFLVSEPQWEEVSSTTRVQRDPNRLPLRSNSTRRWLTTVKPATFSSRPRSLRSSQELRWRKKSRGSMASINTAGGPTFTVESADD